MSIYEPINLLPVIFSIENSQAKMCHKNSTPKIKKVFKNTFNIKPKNDARIIAYNHKLNLLNIFSGIAFTIVIITDQTDFTYITSDVPDKALTITLPTSDG